MNWKIEMIFKHEIYISRSKFRVMYSLCANWSACFYSVYATIHVNNAHKSSLVA